MVEQVDGPDVAPPLNETAQRIVDVALALIDEDGPDGFRVDKVRDQACVSTSSMYHYFGNRAGLLAAVDRERYRRLVNAEDRERLGPAFSATSPAEFQKYIADELHRVLRDPATRAVRRQRVQVGANALDDDELQAEVVRKQRQMFNVIRDIFLAGQQRGLVNPDLDATAYTVWFHAVSLGRVLTQAAYADDDAFFEVAVQAALAPLRLPE